MSVCMQDGEFCSFHAIYIVEGEYKWNLSVSQFFFLVIYAHILDVHRLVSIQ